MEGLDQAPIHLGYIDSVRGIGVFTVLLFHAAVYGQTQGRLGAILKLGDRGVQLFYVASAFTLFLSFSKRRVERFPVQKFFLRRFFRIAPAFYVAMLLKWRMLLHLPGAMKVPDRSYLLGVLFLHGISPAAINSVTNGAWSIADEVIFYLLIPVLFRFLTSTSRSVITYFISSLAVAQLSNYLYVLHPTQASFYQMFWFPRQFTVFILGIVLYTPIGWQTANPI